MRKTILSLMFPVVLYLTSSGEAQNVYKIAGLTATDQYISAYSGFQTKMTELGYKEGRNVAYDFHNAKGDQQALIYLADKIVQNKPTLIVTTSTSDTIPVAKATKESQIPVVFLSAGNPLALVKSYQSSGNNLTGIGTPAIELAAKRMEILKELVPGIKRVFSLVNPGGSNYEDYRQITNEAAEKMKLKLVEVRVNSKAELTRVLPTITREGADAMFLPPDPVIISSIRLIVEHGWRERLPIVGPPAVAKSGALATYGSDHFFLGQQGAVLADKILKGKKPSEIPIEFPAKLKLVLNLKTAKGIGLRIPKEILLRADEVIE